MKQISDVTNYGSLLREIKERIHKAQYEALKAVNKELIALYWDIGSLIVGRQKKHGWGKSVVENLAKDLQLEFPGIRGFSAQNIWYMRQFYIEYHKNIKLQPLVGEISWAKHLVIMSRCKDMLEREFYIRMTRKFGWTKNVLTHHIDNKTYEKTLLNQTNFNKALAPKIRHQAKLAVKDEYTFDFLERGVLRITDIKNDVNLSQKQNIQVICHKSGKPHIDKKEIEKFLVELKYSLYFIDFETINPAIPAYDNSRPFEAIPFQYSLFVVKDIDTKPERFSYIASGSEDPRPEILKQLKALLGTSGSVIAYNAIFEITILRHASEAYPEYQNWVAELENRFVDLLVPFRGFFYYHPNQFGSASLKDVLPVMTKSDYNNLDIAEGNLASIEYYRVTFGKNIDPKERKRVYEALEKYCDLDTKGMIDILEALKKEIK